MKFILSSNQIVFMLDLIGLKTGLPQVTGGRNSQGM